MTGGAEYSERVAALFEAAEGSAMPEGPGWVAGEAREPLSATHVRVYLRCEAGRVAELRYAVRGCPHVVAAVALIAERAGGCAVGDLGADLRAVARELGAPATKLGRLFTVQDAIQQAVLQLDEGRP
jgi:NifU-like protein involved in Fe-S cluster formation